MQNHLMYVFLSTCMFLFSHPMYAQFEADIEGGAAFTGYNDIQIPADEGTFINLKDRFMVDPSYFFRLRASYTFDDKHTLSLLYAPLSFRAVRLEGRPIAFAGETFSGQLPLDLYWQFNSYRLTYRYLFPRTDKLKFGIGLTAKIRDARIRVSNEVSEAEKENVGFVPLINFQLEWFAMERMSVLLQGDALVSFNGRAEDVMLAAQFYLSRLSSLRIGYRILEGGADSDEVYNFSLIHYALIGGTIRF
ncbi:MAG: hypothetical protein ACLFOZ_03415 [Cyclobacteriaceae bacterium]